MSKAVPEWLPELIDTSGSWEEILGRLYSVFEKDFKNNRPTLQGKQVWWDRNFKDGDPHEEGFWHLVTREDKETRERLLDTPRAKRLAWCRAIVAHCQEAEVLFFDYLEGGGKIGTYLWLKNYDYVVILNKKPTRRFGEVYWLVTAYVLDGASRRKALQKKYDNRVQEMQSPP